jgi:hypothetical protein
MFVKQRNFQILVNLSVIDVPRCTTSNEKTLGLENLKLLNAAANGIPANGACYVHHWADELLTRQEKDGKAASSR